MTQLISWDQLKSYQPDNGDYINQKRFALGIRANSQLNGVVDAFNGIASVAIPTWTGALSIPQDLLSIYQDLVFSLVG